MVGGVAKLYGGAMPDVLCEEPNTAEELYIKIINAGRTAMGKCLNIMFLEEKATASRSLDEKHYPYLKIIRSSDAVKRNAQIIPVIPVATAFFPSTIRPPSK